MSDVKPLVYVPDCRQSHLLLSGGDEALEFFRPVLHEDHFGDRRGRSLVELDHEETLPVSGQIIIAKDKT
jgi:hypothetical protein